MMKFKNSQHIESRSEGSGEHPDAKINFNYFMKLMGEEKPKKCVANMRRMFFKHHGCDYDAEYLPYEIYNYRYEINSITNEQVKIIYEPIYVLFFWHHKGN